jgi:hypothetical protein
MATENNDLGDFYGAASVYRAIPNGIDRAKFNTALIIAERVLSARQNLQKNAGSPSQRVVCTTTYSEKSAPTLAGQEAARLDQRTENRNVTRKRQ